MSVVKTQGTQLFVVTGGDTPVITEIPCVDSVTGVGGGAADKLETTCLKERQTRTYVQGLTTPADINIPVNYDDDAEIIATLAALKASGEVVTFIAAFSNGDEAVVPTVTSGAVVYPTGRTFLEFDGFVAQFPYDIAANSLVKNPMVITASGTPVLHPKTVA